MSYSLASLQSQLRALSQCGASIRPPRITLPRTETFQHLACLWEESFPTASAAQAAAQNQLRPLYESAAAQMAAFTDPDAPEGMPLRFQSAFRRALMSLRTDVLFYRSTGNAAVVNRLCAMLTPEAVTAELTGLTKSLAEQGTPPVYSDACARIRYEVHDPSDGESGLAWLAAKAFRRHGYDLLPAVQWLEETGSTRLDAYARTFAAQATLLVESKLVLPVQAKLPLLARRH